LGQDVLTDRVVARGLFEKRIADGLDSGNILLSDSRSSSDLLICLVDKVMRDTGITWIIGDIRTLLSISI